MRDDLAAFLAQAARMMGAGSAELLGAAALNLWGAPQTRVYLGPAALSAGDWIYVPQSDVLGIVDADTAADSRFVTVNPVQQYHEAPTTEISLPRGRSVPPHLNPNSHSRAFGFCLPGCRPSLAFQRLCSDLPELLERLGYVEVDGKWLIDVDRTLLADLRSRAPVDRDFAAELLRRRLDADEPGMPAAPFERFRWVMAQAGMWKVKLEGSGILLAGDWVMFGDGELGFADRLPRPAGTELSIGVSVYPMGPLGPSVVERRDLLFTTAKGLATEIDPFAWPDSPFVRRRDEITEFVARLTEAAVLIAMPEPASVPAELTAELDASAPPSVADHPIQVYEFVGSRNKRIRDFAKLRSVFLLGAGWSYRIKITYDIIEGYDPTLIQSYADYLGLDPRSDRTYRAADQGLPPITVSRRRHGGRNEAWISGLDAVVDALRLATGDYLFVTFQRDTYTAYPRRWEELGSSDPLGELLWSCGLDPRDDQTRKRPWARLARVLGKEGSSREDVRAALLNRRDQYRLDLLDEAQPDSEVVILPWPAAWRFVAPQAADDLFKLANPGSYRIAVGWANPQDLTGPQHWVVSSDGIIWIQVEAKNGEVPTADGELQKLIDSPPPGVIAVPHEWVQWAKAEHNACRLAVVDGVGWTLMRTTGGWMSDDGPTADSLLSALESLPRSNRLAVDVDVPDHAIPQYPRRALDFKLAERQAVRRGITALRGVPGLGLQGEFSDGRRRTGLAVVQALG